MRVIDLGGRGREDYDGGVYDRRGGRSRRSDGTYMGYGGDIYGHHGREDMERREMELERRERELDRREREMGMSPRAYREDEMRRRGWFGERDIRDDMDYSDPYPYGRGGCYY